MFAAYWVTGMFYGRQIANQQTQINEQQTHIGLLDGQLTALRQNQAAAAASPPSQWRRLTDIQRGQLLITLKTNKFSMLVVYAMADSEPRQYAAQFVDVFRAAGIQTISREEPISVAVDVGLMIGVVEFNKPSDDAKRFMELLSSLGLEAHYTWWGKQGMPDQSTVDFDLFVGPKSW